MRITEVLTELSFHGSKCTKDCSGHSAGYAWSMQHQGAPCNSTNPSFNAGCGIAGDQVKNNAVVRPKIRTARGTFGPKPIQKQKVQTTVVPGKATTPNTV